MRLADLHAPDGTRLALHDLGGHDLGRQGTRIVLLPGLCGYSGEWAGTAAWLSATHHVFGLDPRGHGESEQRPADVSREARVSDAVTALEQLGPSVLIGQSLGGDTACLTAAARPDLVKALVMVEAGPEGTTSETTESIDSWLRSWPVPFPDLDEAASFLGGGLVGAAWAGGLIQKQDGWYPAFAPEVMTAMIDASQGARWTDFSSLTCPILVVKGASGFMPAEVFARMREHPKVTAVEVPGAGHDVHLDSPEAWREALTGWLAGLEPRS